MIIFCDPAQGNQVMAYYTHDTASTVWEARGCVRHEVDGEVAEAVRWWGRDCRVSFDVDSQVYQAVPSVNPIQPRAEV